MNLTPTELKVLEWAMPTGIISRRYIYGADEADTRKLRDAFSSLVKVGALSEHVVFHSTATGRDHKRYYITPTGFRALVAGLPADHPLKSFIEPCTIRTGLSIAGQNRIVRMADVKTILAGLGVADMYSLIASGQNPFSFFGPPKSSSPYQNAYDPDSSNYVDQVMAKMIQHAKDSGMTMDFEACDRPIFMPTRHIHAPKKPTNNALGVIVDFRDTTAYVVFKNLVDDPKNLFWAKRAYEFMLINPSFQTHKINTYYAATPRIALLFLDQVHSLGTLVDTVVHQSPKGFPAPFGNFLPIVLRESYPDGIPLLRQLMQVGLQTMYQREQARIICHYPSLVCWPQDFNHLYYNGNKILIGTILNLSQITIYMKWNSNDYWICYADQVALYERFVPHNHIISIPRHD